MSLAAVLFGLFPLTSWALPDLVIAKYQARISIEYKSRIFTASECAYQEGCVRGTGARKLLLLDVGIRNKGTTDLVIGHPLRPKGRYPRDLFEWSGCHGHYHLKGLATYRLLTLGGQQVAKTYKQGFCLRDDTPSSANPKPARYTCDFQGLSVGWMDMYTKGLDCQWVDITGVPPGVYNLEITVNPTRIFPESNYINNRVIITINVPNGI